MLRRIAESDGIICPIEFSDLPFTPNRVFYVSNVPKGEERGNHAHYKNQQLLICIQGIIEVKLKDSRQERLVVESHILYPSESIFIDSMVWDSQIYYTGSDILLSLCSCPYDDKDYIHTYTEYITQCTKVLLDQKG